MSDATSPTDDRASGTILIIDDDDDIRLLVHRFLEHAGFRVLEEARDGPQALDILDRLDPPRVPSVIVLDSRLPTMSGLTVAAAVLERTPDQRIVLFCADLSPALESEATKLGISACLAKTDLPRLAETISNLMAA